MRMKKNAVALSVAALVAGLGFTGVASADVIQTATAVDLRVSPGGIGHSLLLPYFTVQNGNATIFSVVNTDTVNGKAVKVRFRGASNSDDLFDFQLFLSPADVWTATVSQGTDGRATLTTNDNSCTLPSQVRGGTNSFVLDRLPSYLSDDARAAQTREGYVEIFNMADIHPNSTPGSLYSTIKHVGGVAPCADSVLASLLTNPTTEGEANARGLYAPSTGLFGSYAYVNQVQASTSWSNEMTAIVASNVMGVAAPGLGNIVFFPQTGDFLPNGDLVTADPLLRTFSGPVVQPLMFDAPDMSTPYLQGVLDNTRPAIQAAQLSQAIATNSIRNEFVTTDSISAKTDWSISFPTRRYSVAVDYATSAVLSNAVYSNAALNYFSQANTSLNKAGAIPQICVGTRANGTSSAADLRVYDREEQSSQSGFVISPGTAQTFRFCGEVSVLSFNNGAGATETGVLKAQLAVQNVQVNYKEGWATLATNGLGNGLPLLGRYFLVATNPANGNFSTNFGASWEHRYDRPN